MQLPCASSLEGANRATPKSLLSPVPTTTTTSSNTDYKARKLMPGLSDRLSISLRQANQNQNQPGQMESISRASQRLPIPSLSVPLRDKLNLLPRSPSATSISVRHRTIFPYCRASQRNILLPRPVHNILHKVRYELQHG